MINLTQHFATAEQIEDGVVDLKGEELAALKQALTFDELPGDLEIADAVRAIVEIADRSGFSTAMIGGAPYLMAPLQEALKEKGITPFYAFTKRESVEAVQPDGSVRKTNVFRHVGFVIGQ